MATVVISGCSTGIGFATALAFERMSDEEWTDVGALDDAAWYSRIESDFGGLDARPAS